MVPVRRDRGNRLRPRAPAARPEAQLSEGWLFYGVATLAIVLVGLAKGGFAGLGAVAMPLIALVMDPVKGAAMLLPILIVQDVVSIWAFRRSYDAPTLAWTVPGALIGIVIGWLFAVSVDSHIVAALVGLIAIAFGVYRLAGITVTGSRPLPQWFASFWGAIAGFTSQVAHAGGPPFQVWALTRNFPHTVFIGTSAIFFAVINWMKVPAYIALGQFTADNMRLTLIFLPIAIISTFAGVWLVKRLDPARFHKIINVLMVAVGLLLLWEAAL